MVCLDDFLAISLKKESSLSCCPEEQNRNEETAETQNIP